MPMAEDVVRDPARWNSPETLPNDGQYQLLISGGDHPMEDADPFVTIGISGPTDKGAIYAGWNWCLDGHVTIYTSDCEDTHNPRGLTPGTLLGWLPLGPAST